MAGVELGEAFVSIRASMKRLDGDLNQARKRISSSLQKTGRSMQQAGSTMTSRVTLPVAALGAAIVKTSFTFRKEMNRVQALTGTTGKQFQALENQAKQLGRTTEFSAGQAAGAMGFLAQAGFNATEILDALPGVLQLASAGQLDLARAGDIASNVMQQFNIEAKNMGRVNDVLAATASSTNTNIEQMAQALSLAGPAANSAGISLEEVTATVGLFGNAGVQACYDDQTEVLTNRGWVFWPDVTEDDLIASVDPDTQHMTFERQHKLHIYDYNGPMYRVSTRGLDMSVTPNHRMYVRRRDHSEWEIIKAEDLYGKQVSHLAHVEWEGQDYDTITVDGFDQWRGSWWKTVPPVEIDAATWMRLLGYYLSEGSKGYRKGTYRIQIAQKPGERYDRILADLQKLPWQVARRKNGIVIYSEQLYRALPDGKAWEKRIPDQVKGASRRLLKEFLAAFTLGDGDDNGALYTSSKGMADDLSEVVLKCGYATSTVQRQSVGDQNRMSSGRIITARHDSWKVNVRRSQMEPVVSPYEYKGVHGKRYDQSRGAVGEWWEQYNGKVYCAEVPGGLMIVRRSGKAYVCGNTKAGTALRRGILNLISPTDQMQDAMDQVGLTVTDAEGNFKSMDEIVRQLEVGFEDVSSASERTAILAEIFGARAVSAWSTLIGQSGDLEDAIERLNNDVDGFAGKIQEIQLQGIVGALAELKSAAEGAALSIAGKGGLDETIISVSETLTDWFRALSDADSETLKFGVTIAGLTAVIGPLTAALGFLFIGIGKFISVVGALRFALLPLMGPAGLILGLAGAATFLAIKFSDQLPSALGDTEQATKELREANEKLQEVLNDDTATRNQIDNAIESARARREDALAALEQAEASIQAARAGEEFMDKEAFSRATARANTLRGELEELRGTIQDGLAKSADIAAESADKMGKSFEAGTGAVSAATKEVEAGSGALADMNNAVDDTSQSLSELPNVAELTEDEFSALDDTITDLVKNNEALFGSFEDVAEGAEGAKSEFEEFTSNFRSDEQRLDSFRKKLEFLNQQFQDGEIGAERYDSEVRMLSDGLSDMVKDTEDAEDSTESLWRSMDTIAEDTITGIRDAWVGTFQDLFRGQIDSFGDFFDSVKNLFIDMLAEMAASLVASKIFEFFGGEGGFSLGDFSIDLGGGSNGFSLADIGSSIKGLFTGGGDGGGGGIMSSLTSAGSAIKAGGSKVLSALGVGGGGAGGAAGAGATSAQVASTQAAGGAIAPTASFGTGSLSGGWAGGSVAGPGGSFTAGSAGNAAAGSSAGGFGAMGAGTLALAPAAVLAGREIMKMTGLDTGASNLAKTRAARDQSGFQGRGPMGTQVGEGGGFSFAQGGGAGFAREFASDQGITAFEADVTTGLQGFKDVAQETLIHILEDANRKFEQLKQSATSTFDLGQNGAAKVGKALQDGVINQAELASLGFIEMGERIVHAETGAVSLGDVTATQFEKIINAVKKGEIRMGALQGETDLTQREMRVLGDIGISAHNKVVQGANRAAGAERSFGSTASGVMNNVRSTAQSAGKSFGQSFQDGANQASSSLRSLGQAASGTLQGIAGEAQSTARSIGEIARARSQAAQAGRHGINIPGPSSVRGLAHGGIVRQPTLALIGEGREDEIVAPLSDFDRMVDERSNRGMSVTINQNIQGGTPGEVERQTRRAIQRIADEFPIR